MLPVPTDTRSSSNIDSVVSKLWAEKLTVKYIAVINIVRPPYYDETARTQVCNRCLGGDNVIIKIGCVNLERTSNRISTHIVSPSKYSAGIRTLRPNDDEAAMVKHAIAI